MKTHNFEVGDKVTYVPDYGRSNKGIVKEIPEHTDDSVRVVYNCNDDWKNYKDYTSSLTNVRNLVKGWVSSSSGEVH